MSMSLAEAEAFRQLKESVERLREGQRAALERIESLESEKAKSGKASKAK